MAPVVPRVRFVIANRQEVRRMRRSRGRKLIGQMLIEKGHITDEQLEQALAAQEQSTQRIGEILMDLGFLAE
jgi:SOS response regulatory protein OraA/RecX